MVLEAATRTKKRQEAAKIGQVQEIHPPAQESWKLLLEAEWDAENLLEHSATVQLLDLQILHGHQDGHHRTPRVEVCLVDGSPSQGEGDPSVHPNYAEA